MRPASPADVPGALPACPYTSILPVSLVVHFHQLLVGVAHVLGNTRIIEIRIRTVRLDNLDGIAQRILPG